MSMSTETTPNFLQQLEKLLQSHRDGHQITYADMVQLRNIALRQMSTIAFQRQAENPEKAEKPIQEFNDQGWHRLVLPSSGKATAWTPYSCAAYLNGYVGATAYYLGVEDVVTPEEFCMKSMTGATE